MAFRIAIGGCRYFEEYAFFCTVVTECLGMAGDVEGIRILSGHCSGVDRMAEQFANERGIPLEIYPADWSRYGRAAGPIRNKEMVEKADMVIAFWDGKSRGTKSLIENATHLGKTLHVVQIEKETFCIEKSFVT